MRVFSLLLVFLAMTASSATPQVAPDAPVIRAIKYQGFRGITVDRIVERLKDRGVAISVERPYDPRIVDSARTVLNELIDESGRTGVKVKSEVVSVPPHSVSITFTVVGK